MSILTEEIQQRIRDEFPKYPDKRAVTLPALHIVHAAMRCVPLPAVVEIAALLDLHPAEVLDTMTFYGFFRREGDPQGKHRVFVCRSISCMLRGGEELLADLCHRLALRPGETTADGRVTLEFAECLGACEGAPCLLVDDACYTNQNTDSALNMIQKL